MARDPIPSHAKLVFKGVIFEVWQWEQKMFDGSTEIFERLKRPDTAVVLATVDEKILVLDQEQPDTVAPFTSIPGGRCDDGEAPLAGAQRELLEETGYASDEWLLWLEESPVGKIQWTVHYYIAKNVRKVAEPHLDAGEKISLRMVNFEEFLMFTDDPSFSERELVPAMLRARFDPQKKEVLRKMLFG